MSPPGVPCSNDTTTPGSWICHTTWNPSSFVDVSAENQKKSSWLVEMSGSPGGMSPQNFPERNHQYQISKNILICNILKCKPPLIVSQQNHEKRTIQAAAYNRINTSITISYFTNNMR